MKAKKQFGQNFLNNDTIINNIVSLLNVEENDLIIEIGPGRGALTNRLVNLKANLLCIEIDTDMHIYLDKYENNKCHIEYVDILSCNIKELLKKYSYNNLYVIGNLPYYITSPIMEYLIKCNINIKKMIFMVQKEVAQRFTSLPKNKEYGYMTLFLNYYYDVNYEFNVNKNNFNPVPKVDSAIITLDNKKKDYSKEDDNYFKFLKEAFKFKRKTLKNNLNNYNFESIKSILNNNGLNDSARPEELSQEVFIEIYNELKKTK